MKVVIKKSSTYELLLNEEGISPYGEHFETIPDVLADDFADDDEKTKTIVYSFEGNYGLANKETYNVLVFNDEGIMTFNGEVDDKL